MNIGIIDAIILLFILLGGLIGFKEGAIKKISTVIGLILVVVLSFTLKNKLSVYFYENLPFLDLWGVFKGIQILNVIFYEVLAFIIIASVLMLVYRLLLRLTGLIEKILKATVILSIPSKIIGFIVGIVESYIWVYIFIFILTLPLINLKDIRNSQVASYIMENTPVLSKYTSKTVEVYNDIYDIINNKTDKTNEQINEETMDLMLKYDIITTASAEKLIDRNKVSVNNKDFINKYK